ncbi:MAG: tRNA (adenosine(37)-N6)-threonylcarbamoyltransferase complex dimerization subunit type 1 TsaB [Rhodobacter sp.]|nr:tRNA (adenosine(37)-N6)-threonylcarbamoyltransferase complex dimerization subunit type 1 TsaB [Rhodobacter sp.]
MPEPLVLGFDTSGPYCGAALLAGERCLAERHESMARGQAERLLPMLTELLEGAGVAWRDLDAVGVGVGPGSFTGVRISVSAARGLALGLGVPALGVTLLEAVAHGVERPVLACLDAHRGMGYFQRHGFGDPAPFIASPENIDGIPGSGIRCVGSLAEKTASRLGAGCASARFAPARAISLIAAGRQKAGSPIERPAPLYLRAPDARPATKDAPMIPA